jgi:hypothetical protein
MPNEICILCGKETTVDVSTHIDFRIGYIEGAGQLCIECYSKGSPSSREQITIPKHWIKTYPNDAELGEKVRQHYWNEYEDIELPKTSSLNEPQIENQWVCKICGRDTSEIDYDYLIGTNHLECELKKELGE